MRQVIPLLTAGTLVLGACDMPTEPSGIGSTRLGANAPEGAAPGTCWDKQVIPAKVQTVTEDVLVKPAQISESGTVQSPPIYRSETRQVILAERQENFVQIPCPIDLTPEFIASVQRALGARGYYAGPPTGQLDPLTQEAVARYQMDQGQDRAVLTVATAQQLGLWTVNF